MLAGLGSDRLTKWLDEDLKDRSPVGKLRAYKTLKSVLKWAVRAGWVPFNACDRIDRPLAVPAERQPLDAAQAGALLQAAREGLAWLHALVAFGLAGLRISEALALRWVNVVGGKIDIHRVCIEMTNGERRFEKPKSRRSRWKISERWTGVSNVEVSVEPFWRDPTTPRHSEHSS